MGRKQVIKAEIKAKIISMDVLPDNVIYELYHWMNLYCCISLSRVARRYKRIFAEYVRRGANIMYIALYDERNYKYIYNKWLVSD